MPTAVLIVDDEKNIRLTLATTLQALEIQTDTAMNGEEALQKVAQRDYDIILLDIKMPGMDGMQVLKQLHRLKPNSSVVMITAHGTVENAVEAMKSGAVDFLRKPFTPDEIREVITTVLHRRILDEQQATTYHDLIQLAKKYAGKDFAAAIIYLRRAIAMSPNKAEAFNFLGALTEIDGDVSEAQKLYRAAIALDPTYKPAYDNLDRTASRQASGNIILI